MRCGRFAKQTLIGAAVGTAFAAAMQGLVMGARTVYAGERAWGMLLHDHIPAMLVLAGAALVSALATSWRAEFTTQGESLLRTGMIAGVVLPVILTGCTNLTPTLAACWGALTGFFASMAVAVVAGLQSQPHQS